MLKLNRTHELELNVGTQVGPYTYAGAWTNVDTGEVQYELVTEYANHPITGERLVMAFMLVNYEKMLELFAEVR